MLSEIVVFVCSFFITTIPVHQAPKGMALVPASASSPAFYMDKTPVTVRQFRQFIRQTNYSTTAQELGSGALYDFEQQQWQLKAGAYWAFPWGAALPSAALDHPVTQVSWDDAQAYCQWANKRLPTRAEWIQAASYGQSTPSLYPWGNDLVIKGKYQANCWQGVFPSLNLMADGFRFTSPVGHYPASILGLSDLAGNVWEWTQDSTIVDGQVEYFQKGGSFLCEKSVCHGYQISGQTSASANSSLFHLGFRCVRDF